MARGLHTEALTAHQALGKSSGGRENEEQRRPWSSARNELGKSGFPRLAPIEPFTSQRLFADPLEISLVSCPFQFDVSGFS